MKIFLGGILFFISLSVIHAQENLKELKQEYKNDTLYIYYDGGKLQSTNTINNGNDAWVKHEYWVTFHFKQNVFHKEDYIRFIKRKYLNFDLKIPDLKLIDQDWIAKNQDKILYPCLFQKFNVIEIYNVLVYKVIYLIEEENFFGNKVYAREVNMFSNYSLEE